jgi:hypothetical protein
MQSSPVLYYLVPFWFRCLPQHQHETAEKIIIPYILIFIFWDSKLEEKILLLKNTNASSSLYIHHITKLFKLKL